jgi:signal transduction histidine kinase
VSEVGAAFQTMVEGLRESVSRQAELEAQRRFFIGAIAHDLRTPLFSLRGHLVGLEQGIASSPEKAAAYLAICRQKADQLDRLVSDLFAYTRTEYLGHTLQRQATDFGELISREIDGLRSRAEAKGVQVCMDGPGKPCVAEIDEDLLERAVENLLDNAIRHTTADGTIHVRWGRAGDRVTFSVSDDGPGIPERDLPHLFEPLYRGEASRNSKTGGTGLGLSIAKRALEAHGGSLVASNHLPRGAEFTGWLPSASP